MVENGHFKKKKGYYRSIQRYVEFCMSDGNLRRDRYLRNELNSNLELKMSTFLEFNRMREMKATIDDIKTALRPSKILDIGNEEIVRKKGPIVEKSKEQIDSCTLYVERIPPDTSPEYLTKTFSSFGKVAYVTIPKYKKNKRIKGFAFVEFENESSCGAALNKFASYGGILGGEKKLQPVHNPCMKNVDGQSEIKYENGGKLEETKLDGMVSDENIHCIDTSPHPIKNKRNRKKKKSQRKLNQCYMGLQILSKNNWNQLRNRYLALQAANRRSIKIQLSKIKRPTSQRSKITQLIQGCVVAISCSLPINELDVRALKKHLGQIEAVEYVDIECGQLNGFLRFTSSDSAHSFLHYASDILPHFKADILPKTLESEYWSKIEKDRIEKFKKLKERKNINGGKTILNRAEKQLGVKISYDL